MTDWTGNSLQLLTAAELDAENGETEEMGGEEVLIFSGDESKEIFCKNILIFLSFIQTIRRWQ